MKILEYDEVNPMSVYHVTMLALDFRLTPEHAAHIRRTDPRPFPCFTVNAVENDRVLGQVGIFRLPMISTEGREDVGGVWAVSTHPQFSGRGIASRLLDEAHERMRQAGLRFSTLGTNRYRSAYRLYRQHGYEDMNVWGTAHACWDSAHLPTRISALRPDSDGFDQIDQIFESIASDYLGFAWRPKPFTHLRDKVNLEEVRILWLAEQPVGYAITHIKKDHLIINNLLLQPGIDAAEAVAAIIAEEKITYIQVTVERPDDISNLKKAGYQIAQPNWDAFMIKPLFPDVTANNARSLFGIGTDRFLISWLDTT